MTDAERDSALSFVMVPVPQEHVLGVMQLILRMDAQGSAGRWDATSVAEAFDAVDDDCRSLLLLVADTSALGAEIDAVDAAQRLQLGVRETAAIVHELNNVARETNRPNLIVAPPRKTTLPDGTVVEQRLLGMESELATLVQAAGRRRAADEP